MAIREIVFDTETTGLDPYQGHRLVEIGCVELINRFPSGKVFHKYLNPERDMPAEAFAVHGLSAEFLRDKPFFADICEELVEFIGDAPLVAHNANFDLGFLNAELERCKHMLVGRERLVDTLMLARRRHPAGPNGLDHLCARYGVDNSRRTKHGALLDAHLAGEPVGRIADALTARGIPFAFVSGYGPEQLPQAYRGVPLVRKPFTGRDLLAAVAHFR